VGIQVVQYDGQSYGVTATARRDTITGMSVAAAQVLSDQSATGDLPGSLSIIDSHISNNPDPSSVLGSIQDNSDNYLTTLRRDA
jgi:hypothetical protein